MVSCLRQVLSRRGTCAHTSIPRAPGQNDGIRALYRPSIADTCFVTSSALSPLVQTSAGLSLPGVFAHCTASRAFRLCTNRKPQSTCLGLPRPWRCVTPKGVLASLCWTVLHERTRSRITDWNPIASALAFTKAYRSHSAELGAMSNCVLLQLLMWLPCMRTLPLVLRLSDAFLAPVCTAVGRQHSLLVLEHVLVHQPRTANQASSYSFQFGPVVSVWTSEALSVSTSICSFPWLRMASQFCL